MILPLLGSRNHTKMCFGRRFCGINGANLGWICGVFNERDCRRRKTCPTIICIWAGEIQRSKPCLLSRHKGLNREGFWARRVLRAVCPNSHFRSRLATTRKLARLVNISAFSRTNKRSCLVFSVASMAPTPRVPHSIDAQRSVIPQRFWEPARMFPIPALAARRPHLPSRRSRQ